MESILDAHFKSFEIVELRNLKVSTADTVLFCMVMGASVGGGAPLEVHCHLHSFEGVQLQIVITTAKCQLSAASLYADSSPSWMRLMAIVLSPNFRRFTDSH